MPRRRTLALAAIALLVATPAALAQQAKPKRIGIIAQGASAGRSAPFVDAFLQRMRELGYVEGRDIALDVRYPRDDRDGFRDSAAALVARKVDVIVAANTGATRAAKQQTTTIPIVMASVGNAVLAGFVDTLARPGGNVTGQSFLGAELQSKGIELVIEALPRARRIVMFYDPELVVTDRPDFSRIIDAAKARGVAVVPLTLRRDDDVGEVLARAGVARPDAVHLAAVSVVEQPRFASTALRLGIPAICASRDAIDGGALITFGPNFVALWRGAATYVDRILKGAKPGELPVEQPTSFELVVNLRAAKALGVTIAPSVVQRADAIVQ